MERPGPTWPICGTRGTMVNEAGRRDEVTVVGSPSTDAQRRLVVETWNETERPYPRDATVHGLFARQARESPDRIALVCGAEQFSYAELQRRSARLAAHLAARGVGPETLVPVCLERSPSLVVAILGILQAGGAYVPIDPAYPQERTALLLDDTEAPLVVTESALAARMEAPGRSVVCVDRELDEPVAPFEPPACGPENLAYVIYTSGSTGTPKGALVPHRAVVRLVVGSDFAAMGPDEVWLQLAPVPFDASTLELWAPLLNGGRCVLFPERVPDLASLRATIRDHGVTSMWLTATLFNTVVDEDPDVLTGLRQLLIGGETLSPPHVARALEALPGTRIINGYGPTENTTFTCCHPISAEDAASGRPIPIGRPVSNTRVYVLDPDGEPVAPGEEGELHAGGDGVARGYLRRPELTAEKFVPDPFGPRPGRLLYRTGDRVRWRADGVLEFLGRMDAQLKLRGFRIEPGEIETTLTALPGVRQAAVAAWDDGRGARRLVAYVVPADAGPPPDTGELTRQLAARLPDHMVPGAFVLLDRLPVTPSGKVDRRALPEPAAAAGEADAPATETERILAEIWRDVLGTRRIGRTDDFFALGGHSLLAVRVLARCRSVFAIAVPVHEAFQCRTIAELAAAVDRARADAAPYEPIQARERDAAVPPSYGQTSMWLEYRLDPESPVYNEPFGVRLVGALDRGLLQRSLDTVVARHEALRTRMVERDEGPLQETLPDVRVPIATLEPTGEDGEDAVLRAEAARVFDLAEGPLLRAALLQRSEGEHVLLVTFHHLVVDDWSVQLFFRELGEAYRAGLEDRPTRLPELSVQYPDVALWCHERFRDAGLDTERGYWLDTLRGAALEHGLAPEPESTPGAAGALHEFSLDAARGVRSLCAEAGTTPFLVTLSAFVALLHRLTSREDIVVATPIAGRQRPELADLIGYFLNTVAVRADVSGEPTFRELLGRVRSRMLGAHAHPNVPLDQVLARLRPDRGATRRSPLQVVFVHRTDPVEAPDLPGIDATPVQVDTGTSKFDLTLFLDATDADIRGRIEYRTDVFDEPFVARLAEQYGRLLDAALADPDTRVSRLGGDGMALPGGTGPAPATPAVPAAEPAPADPRPQTDTQRQLLAIWRELLELDDIGVHDDFFRIGGHSLLAVRLFARIEKHLGRSIPVRSIFSAATIAELAEVLDRGEGDAESALPRGIVEIRAGSGTPLFCLPGIGGHVFMFRDLAAKLRPEQPVYGLQLQDLDRTDDTLASVANMARAFIDGMRRVQPEGPYDLAGYSFGGTVAYEMARQLRADGQEARFVAVFDAFAPGAVAPAPKLQKFFLHLRELVRQSPAGIYQYLASRVKRRLGQLRYLLSEKAGRGGREEASFDRRVEEVRIKCMRAAASYEAQPYDGHLWIFRATRITDWVRPSGTDDCNGWASLVPGRTHVIDVECEHLELFREPYLSVLAVALRNELHAARTPDPRA